MLLLTKSNAAPVWDMYLKGFTLMGKIVLNTAL